MNFSVEEENLICMYHTSDRRRTMARMLAALPDMDTEMRRLANGTIAKLEHGIPMEIHIQQDHVRLERSHEILDACRLCRYLHLLHVRLQQ